MWLIRIWTVGVGSQSIRSTTGIDDGLAVIGRGEDLMGELLRPGMVDIR